MYVDIQLKSHTESQCCCSWVCLCLRVHVHTCAWICVEEGGLCMNTIMHHAYKDCSFRLTSQGTCLDLHSHFNYIIVLLVWLVQSPFSFEVSPTTAVNDAMSTLYWTLKPSTQSISWFVVGVSVSKAYIVTSGFAGSEYLLQTAVLQVLTAYFRVLTVYHHWTVIFIHLIHVSNIPLSFIYIIPCLTQCMFSLPMYT